ncbi:MAG TPA: response regulator transcription factor [Ktedonobacteraceae bacterium]|jgi:NarL family two-component system response regulator LiaR|nr:response regulator transcription factor [Ktedonobacteraceae bacterium]
MIRVVIVDDHAVVRQGLRFMLERQADISVIGEGSDGEEAIALATDLIPEVMLLDLLMPKVDGITAIREVKRLTPATQIIVLTSYHDDDMIFRAIKAGALSYLLKDTSPQELIAAVRAAAQGESRLHPTVATRVLREIHAEVQSAFNELTPREREVLSQIARGRSNAEIATALVIGEGTVKMHVSNVLSKLHLADRTQAAIYALQKRLIPLNEALDKDMQP